VKNVFFVTGHNLCAGQDDHPGLDGGKDQPIQNLQIEDMNTRKVAKVEMKTAYKDRWPGTRPDCTIDRISTPTRKIMKARLAILLLRFVSLRTGV
jgi:hypothetical protein